MEKKNMPFFIVLSLIFSIIMYACGGGGGGGSSSDTVAPTTPTNLTATAVSTSQIDLNWDASTDNVGVAGYNVYKEGLKIASSNLPTISVHITNSAESSGTKDSGIDFYELNEENLKTVENVKPTTSPTTTTYSDTELNANTQYCYTVSAYDAAGNESSSSNQVCATTNAVADACGSGLPLVISDLNFPGTVTSDSFVDGSVAYQGKFEDIAKPAMALRFQTATSIITTYVPGPTASNCRINFEGLIPKNISGTGTILFKLVYYYSDDDGLPVYNWEDNGVSNQLSKQVTIQ